MDPCAFVHEALDAVKALGTRKICILGTAKVLIIALHEELTQFSTDHIPLYQLWKIAQAKTLHVVFTGHSCGGAVAQCATAAYLQKFQGYIDETKVLCVAFSPTLIKDRAFVSSTKNFVSFLREFEIRPGFGRYAIVKDTGHLEFHEDVSQPESLEGKRDFHSLEEDLANLLPPAELLFDVVLENPVITNIAVHGKEIVLSGENLELLHTISVAQENPVVVLPDHTAWLSVEKDRHVSVTLTSKLSETVLHTVENVPVKQLSAPRVCLKDLLLHIGMIVCHSFPMSSCLVPEPSCSFVSVLSEVVSKLPMETFLRWFLQQPSEGKGVLQKMSEEKKSLMSRSMLSLLDHCIQEFLTKEAPAAKVCWTAAVQQMATRNPKRPWLRHLFVFQGITSPEELEKTMQHDLLQFVSIFRTRKAS